MAKLFAYSDEESQAIHLSAYLDPVVTLFGPGDQVTQPIFIGLPGFPDACIVLNLLPEGEAVILVLVDASVTLNLLPEAVLTVNDTGGPHFVINLKPEASLTVNLEKC